MWNVNQYQFTFTLLRSKPKTMFLAKHRAKPSRLVVSVFDGSVRFISPATGTILATGFPIDEDFIIKQVAYDMNSDLVYTLNTNGTIIQYDSSHNPFKVEYLWDNSRMASKEFITCICSVDLYNHEAGVDKDVDKRLLSKKGIPPCDYLLFGGTESGKIQYLPFDGKEYHRFLIQAHATSVSQLEYNVRSGILLSATKGNLFPTD
jgi:hypothetical protein